MPTLIQTAKKQRDELARVDAANLAALSRAYANMYQDLQGDVDALMLVIEKLENPTRRQIEQLPQYKRLVRNAERELDDFSSYLKTSVGAAGAAAIGLGLSHSLALLKNLGKNSPGLTGNVIRPLLDYLRRDGPLYRRLDLITTSTVDKVIAAIIDGVSQGFNPRKTAALIQDAFGGGLTDALRNMRTVQLYSYRDAAKANYMAAGVEKWIRYEELDENTCSACWAEHGTIHDIEDSFEGHYNCRGADLPYIEGLTEDIPTGESLFNDLSEAEQRSILGDSKYEALKEGKFEFSQLSSTYESNVFGNMKVETSLKDLVGE